MWSLKSLNTSSDVRSSACLFPPCAFHLYLTLVIHIKKSSGENAHEFGRMNSFFFFLYRAAPVAYGGSQARGQIRAVAASLRHSHRNAGYEPHLQLTPQLMAMQDP